MENRTAHTDGTLRVYSLLPAAEGVIMEDIIHTTIHTDGVLRVYSLLPAAQGVIAEVHMSSAAHFRHKL